MLRPDQVLDKVRTALRSESRVGRENLPEAMSFDDGVITLEGEAKNVAVKKLVLERAAALPEVTGIVDRLHVKPAQRMGDGEIRDAVRGVLMQEPAFQDLAIRERVAGRIDPVREPPQARGAIYIEVQDGIVILDGRVPGLDDKRLAGVLAWWVPGSRDVIDGIAVDPPEEDSDDAITEAVRLILEKDPFVDAGQIRVTVKDAVVSLKGIVPTESEREMAVFDAWYVFGVDDVVDRIDVG